ncbi:hypothetical protein OS175_14110 [Marinicella sp. S1101]|uniref:hypothetical protein n=1 Tax=Marinicella marina TaxID=2996016 RepID=UPI002260F864|nr:hypothetical protein [Marinicella marina]MCX7555006.1 hypothetical protein [Marinicella marina]MDJ1141330.1 hypothetical protein [Marinicella marina]
MSIMKWFNKPKWQSPNEQVRLTAIQNSKDPDLMSSLGDIVYADASQKVQKVALGRIVDPQVLLQILNQHPNKDIKKQASKKLIIWFTNETNDEQTAIVNAITDPQTIQALAESAHSKTIRKYALDHIKQQGLLGELLFKEKEVALQQLIIDKIETPNKLKKLLNRAQKHNHELYQLINNKLLGTAVTDHNTEALSLCQQLEHVVHGRAEGVELPLIREQWQRIEGGVSEGTKLRFNGAFEAAKMILDPEHRAQFLQQQKRQRAAAQLNELEQFVAKNTDLSLHQIQNALTKYQDLVVSDLSELEIERHKNAIDSLISQRDKVQKEQMIPAGVTAVLDDLNKQLSQAIVQPESLNQFKKRWQKLTRKIQNSEAFTAISQQFNDSCLKLAEKIEHSAQLRQQAAEKAIELIEPTIAQIKDGHLVKAKEMTNQIAELKKTAGYKHRLIENNRFKLDSVWQQLKDLRNWQKWSNDKARQDIIDELKDMLGKGQHPDAVLKKLKEANERWYALENMEKLPGDKFPARNQKMWQEFRLVSKALFEPTQPFFEKRSEQQDSYLNQIEAHIKTIADTDLDNTSERDLAELSRGAIKFLKTLDQLPPKKRGKIAKKIRQAINRVDTKLNEFYAAAEKKKLQLIELAQELVSTEDHAAAIEAAKNLQQQWKTAGIVKQHIERKLWKKFRKANDVIFKRRENEQKAQQAVIMEQTKQASSIIKKFKPMVNKAKTTEALKKIKQEFNQAWTELGQAESLLNNDKQQLLQLITEQTQKLKSSVIQKEHKTKQKLDQHFTDYETGKITEEQKDQLVNTLLTDELTAYFAPRQEKQNQQIDLAELLIQAEFISGLETPAEFMEDRMAYQVKVLSERMSGEKAGSDQEQVSDWLHQWYITPKNDAEFVSSNNKRIKKAIKAMTNHLSQ